MDKPDCSPAHPKLSALDEGFGGFDHLVGRQSVQLVQVFGHIGRLSELAMDTKGFDLVGHSAIRKSVYSSVGQLVDFSLPRKNLLR